MILGTKGGPIILFQFWSYLVTCFYSFSPLSSEEFLGDLFFIAFHPSPLRSFSATCFYSFSPLSSQEFLGDLFL